MEASAHSAHRGDQVLGDAKVGRVNERVVERISGCEADRTAGERSEEADANPKVTVIIDKLREVGAPLLAVSLVVRVDDCIYGGANCKKV